MLVLRGAWEGGLLAKRRGTKSVSRVGWEGARRRENVVRTDFIFRFGNEQTEKNDRKRYP